MYTPDIVEVRHFYSSPLGLAACNVLRSRIRRIWPDIGGDTLAGIGYAVPYLVPYQNREATLAAFMPPQLGISRWAQEGGNMACMAEETALPLRESSIDRLLAIHIVESSESLGQLMEEMWRVLTPGGRLLVVVPNRRGLWAKADSTPFGHGRPYSLGQILQLMRDSMFTPVRSEYALFMPPSRSSMNIRSGQLIEKIGERFFELFGGVLIVEAEKQIYAVRPAPAKTRKSLIPLPVTSPAPAG